MHVDNIAVSTAVCRRRARGDRRPNPILLSLVFSFLLLVLHSLCHSFFCFPSSLSLSLFYSLSLLPISLPLTLILTLILTFTHTVPQVN